MATGKRPLVLDTGYSGDVEATVKQLVNAVNTLRSELAVTPGIGELRAGVAITAGKAIYIAGQQLYLASAVAVQPAIGISISSGNIGDKVRYILGMGYAAGLTGLTPNSAVYLGNAGALVYAIPGAGMKQALGWTFSATEMFVTIGQPF